jgi:DNA-binding CsgD family transcriptional regulator
MTRADRQAIQEVRDELRRGYPGAHWRETYSRAVAEAYRKSDIATVAELAAIAATYLAADACIEDAVADVEFAIRLAARSPEAQAHLLRVRSSLQILEADPRAALAALDGARTLTPHPASDRDVADQSIRETIARCVCLHDMTLDEVSAAHALAEGTEYEWLATGLKVWAAPWLFAIGRPRDATPWIESLEVQAVVIDSTWRTADAAAYRRQDLVARGRRPAQAPAGLRPGAPNYLATWATASLDLHQGVLYGEHEGARDALERMRAMEGALPPCLTCAETAFAALLGAVCDGAAAGALEPPPVPSLINLPAVFAAAHAVAAAGTQEQAAQWRRWFDAEIPAHVRTSGAWPDSIERIRGLLAARAGDLRNAVMRMRAAVRWADRVDYAAEGAVARVQLAELLALVPRTVARSEWLALRNEGRERCRDLGIPSAIHADVATSAAALGRFDSQRPQLTAREVEVLGQMALGLSYQEAGERLGLRWRTVQTHAYHAYQKLGVSSKVAAVAEARELGLL